MRLENGSVRLQNSYVQLGANALGISLSDELAGGTLWEIQFIATITVLLLVLQI